MEEKKINAPTSSMKKAEKKIPRKKLPKIYKKKYSAKKFQKKLLKRLYVPEDRMFVENLFVADEATKELIIPEGETFTKSELLRLKRLSKEIKKQKGGIKFVPLVAVIALCVAVVVTVTFFKNIIIKRAIVSGMQNVFNAKTDLQSVDFQFFDASLKLRGLAQASNSNPMKNIFELGNVQINFNLTELLRGKAHIENVTVAGVDWNTDRKTSGELPARQKKQKPETPSVVTVKTNQLVSDVQQKLKDTFDEYNPVSIVENMRGELQSSLAAQEIGVSVQEKVERWRGVPDEVRVVVEDFSASIQDVVAIDWSKVNDVTRLRNNLATINNAIVQGNNLSNEIQTLTQSVQEDANDVKLFAEKISGAVAADRALIEAQINKFSALRTTGINGIVNDMLSTVIYSLAGEYYPYVQQGIDYARMLKSKSETLSKSEKPKKKSAVSRAVGRDIYWKRDAVPIFLMEELYTSGKNFEAGIQNLSSDMERWGRAATFDGSLSLFGHDHSLGLTVDTRGAAASLIDGIYDGTDWNIAVAFPSFGIDSNSDISARLRAGLDGSFSVSGIVDMADVKFATEKFEPEILYSIYQKALATLDEISVGFTLSRFADGNIDLRLDTDAEEKFIPRLAEMFKAETLSIMSETKERLFDEIENYTKDITDKIAEFTGIEVDVRNLKVDMSKSQAKLDEAQKKITEQIAKQTGSAVQNVIDQTLSEQVKDSPLGTIINKTIGGEKTEEAVNKGLNSLFDRIKSEASKNKGE